MKKRFIIICLLTTLTLCACNELGGGNYSATKSSRSSNSSSVEMDHATYCMLYMNVSNVEISHKYNYTYVKGIISNTGSYQIKYVKVKAVCKDKSGNIIDTDWTYAVDSTWLDPGESKSFEMMVKDEKAEIKKADVTVVFE